MAEAEKWATWDRYVLRRNWEREVKVYSGRECREEEYMGKVYVEGPFEVEGK